MIYIENKNGTQRVLIPTNDTNVEYVNFVPQEGDSDYYTKTQTDEKIAQSRTAVLGEVGDWLSHYPTTDQMHDAIEGYLFRATEYTDHGGIPTAVELVGRSLGELFDDLQNNRNVNVSLFEHDVHTVLMQGCEFGDDYCTIYFQEPTRFVLVTFDVTEVQDVTCVPVSDIHGPSSVIINLSGNMNLPVDAFNKLHNAHQDGTAGIVIQNNTVHSVVGSTDDSITLMGKDSLVIYTNTNGVITKTTMALADKEYVDEAIANMSSGGGSGGDSGVKVYEALRDDATGQYTRVTNQMVSDMCDDYYNGLKVQLMYNNMLLTVYFAKEESPYYYVYVLGFTVIAEFIGYYSNSPSDDAIFKEYPLVTHEVFDRAIPHKYVYTITNDIALTGYFSQGEGYELFNDVRDGADVNFKLIMFDGQSKYIPVSINYDRNTGKVGFAFLDFGRYIIGTLESNGDMAISTENFN